MRRPCSRTGGVTRILLFSTAQSAGRRVARKWVELFLPSSRGVMPFALHCSAGSGRTTAPLPCKARVRVFELPQQRIRGRRCGRFAVGAVQARASGKTVRKRPFPFTRIAGQEEMKQALVLNVIDPNIGGVLIMGDRGTGKSVAVRSAPDQWLRRHALRTPTRIGGARGRSVARRAA